MKLNSLLGIKPINANKVSLPVLRLPYFYEPESLGATIAVQVILLDLTNSCQLKIHSPVKENRFLGKKVAAHSDAINFRVMTKD